MLEKSRLWSARLLIALVVGWNLQAAIAFILWPERYAPGFELTGVPGAAAMRGTGILFLMWTVPYVVALWHPRKHRPFVLTALLMQFVGLVGESLILISLPQGYASLHTSIVRFIAFDAGGLVLLIAALWLSNNKVEMEQVW